MVLSDISIRRPVFATVISLMLIVLGSAAYTRMAVREYPSVDPPFVSIQTVYRGASGEVVESQVTQVVESAIAGIEGIKTVTSSSREERSNVNIEFELSRNMESAANDVRDKVSRAVGRLPDGAEAPVVRKQDADAQAIVAFTFTSDRFSHIELSDIVGRQLVDQLSILPGVAQVNIFGERRQAMRIWLDRNAMAARAITVDDVATSIRRQNMEMPAGRIESTAREFSIRADTRLRTPDQLSNIVVANRGGYQVRLGEIASVEIGPEDNRSEARANGKPSISVGVSRQATANTLEVADAAKEEMEKLKASLPPGIDVDIGYDESVFIRESMNQVYEALIIGLVMVIGIIFIFLRSVRATMIPTVAIPVSVIASFIVTASLGYSVNVLTMLALVLAIGIVVDDAIVVLENIHRRIEEGEPPLLAAVRGARQITFAVIATTLVLVSVFVPISFMEGSTGRLFSEFGLSLAASVVFSCLVSLTLTPMMCSKFLTDHSHESTLVRLTQPVFDGMINGYRWMLGKALNANLIVLAIGVGTSLLAVQLFSAIPREFAPTEDRGQFVMPINAPEGSSLAYTREAVIEVEKIVQPLVAQGVATMVYGTLGGQGGQVNSAFLIVRLKPWNERTRSQQDIVREIVPKLQAVPGVRVSATNPPSLGNRGFGAGVQIALGGPDYDTLKEWRDRLILRASENPKIVNLDSNFRENKPELRVTIDRLKSSDLGVSIDQIGRTLKVLFGAESMSAFVDRGEEYSIIAQAVAPDRASPNDLTNVFVRSTTTNQLIPLSNLVMLQEAAGPQELNRFDRMRSITVSASIAPDYSLGEALDYMDKIIAEELPAEARTRYTGQSRTFKETTNSLYITFGLALLVVFLVLAAQFESFIHPLIIMLAVPLAVTGGLAGLYFAGMSLNVYSHIGMILLIGLMAKNGILIVEFANQLRDQGHDIRSAVVNAAAARLRPILMTSIATVFGALPLAVGSGAGAEGRKAIATVIIGGIILSTVLTLFIIPSLYLMLARFTRPINAIAQRLSAMETAQPAPTARHAAAAE